MVPVDADGEAAYEGLAALFGGGGVGFVGEEDGAGAGSPGWVSLLSEMC